MHQITKQYNSNPRNIYSQQSTTRSNQNTEPSAKKQKLTPQQQYQSLQQQIYQKGVIKSPESISNLQTRSKTPSNPNSFSKTPQKSILLNQSDNHSLIMNNRGIYELNRTSYKSPRSQQQKNGVNNIPQYYSQQQLTHKKSVQSPVSNFNDYNSVQQQQQPQQLQQSTQNNNNNSIMNNSPVNSSNYHSQSNQTTQNLNPKTNDIKQQIRIIFVFYASFGDRTNITNLRSNRFHKLIQDAQIHDEILTKKKLDLLFVQENKHQSNMQFSTFLNLLPKIASLKYPNMPSDKALLELFFNHLQPLNQSILNDTDLGQDLEQLSQPIEPDCMRVLVSLQDILHKIYNIYFPWEPCNSLKSHQLYTKTLQALFNFLKDYDICPRVLTKSICFLLFNDLVDTPVEHITHSPHFRNQEIFGFQDKGKLLTINKFFVFIIRCSLITFSQKNSPNAPYTTQVEKLNALLERMELSDGFQTFEKKTHSTHNDKTTLLIPKQLVNQLSLEGSLELDLVRSRRNINGSQQLEQQSKILQSKMFMESKIFSSCRSPERSKIKSTLLESLKFTMDILPVLQKYSETLQKIFKYYCSFGEPLNQSTLKSTKLLKLLKDAELVQEQTAASAQKSTYQQYRKSIDMSRSNMNTSVSGSPSKIENSTRQIKILDVDFIFAKLTGHGWIKNYNKKTASYNKSIKSPSLGMSNYQLKNQIPQGAKGKLEYEHFLKCLEEIATKLYPEYDTEQALAIIIETHLLKLEQKISDNKQQKNNYLQLLMEILKDSDLVEILSDIHKSIFIYYKYYADSKGQMNIQKFIQFAQDFEIFPDLLSKQKLHSIFYSLATLYQTNEDQQQNNDQILQNSSQKFQSNNSQMISPNKKNQNFMNSQASQQSQLFQNNKSCSFFNSQSKVINQTDQPEDEIIDQHLFVEATALMAVEVYNTEPLYAFRQLMFIERINASKGPKLIQKKQGHTRSTTGISWDIMSGLRHKYAQFYQSKAKKSKLFTPGNFDNAIESALNNDEYSVQYVSQDDNIQQNDQQQQQISQINQQIYVNDEQQEQEELEQQQQQQLQQNYVSEQQQQSFNKAVLSQFNSQQRRQSELSQQLQQQQQNGEQLQQYYSQQQSPSK